MAKIYNLGTYPAIVRTRNSITYTIPPSGNITLPDMEVDYDMVDAGLEAGTLRVTRDDGSPLLQNYANSLQPWQSQDVNQNYTDTGRLKTTSLQTRFFNTFKYHTGLDFWDEELLLGATCTHSQQQSSILLSVSTTPGSKVTRQTRQVIPYIPGRPAELSMAFNLGLPTPGVAVRVGLFNNNNGPFFEQGADGEYYCCIRTSTSGTVSDARKIPRGQWNGDRLDGYGVSGKAVDFSKIQLMTISYEWYGAGQVEFAFVIDGRSHTIHTFNNANVLGTVWVRTPYLPIRIQVENVSGSSSKTVLQSSVSFGAEGSSSYFGVPMFLGRNTQTLADAGVFYPAISLKLKDNSLCGVVSLSSFQAFTPDNTYLYWRLVVNPTLNGGGGWVDHPLPFSSTQVNTTSTTYTGGTVFAEGVVPANAAMTDIDTIGNVFQIARHDMGLTSDIVTLAIAAAGTNKAASTYMRWLEQR